MLIFEEHFETSLLNISTEELFAFLAETKNKRTLNRKLSALNSFYDFCYKSEFTENLQKFKLSKLPQNLPHYLPAQKIYEGLKSIDKSKWIGQRDYAFILFLFASGARISEALEAKFSDFEDGWLKIRFAKGEKERLVPIAAQALEAIDVYRKSFESQNEYIWLNYKGEKLSRISAFKVMKKYLGVSPHVLRHSYATSMILGGAELRVVQELLGHSSLVTTQIYTHIQKQDLQDTVQTYHPLAKGGL